MPSPPRSALLALIVALLAMATGGCCGRAPMEPASEPPSDAPEDATLDPEGDQYPSD